MADSRGERIVRSRITIAIIASGATLLAAGGLGYASIPSSSGLVTTCYSTSTGALRVIDRDAGRTCRAGEHQLQINQRGLRGLRGATGARGPAGPAAPRIVAGGVVFVDPAETTGFVGLGMVQNLATTADQTAVPLPVAGTLRGLRVVVGTLAAGSIDATVVVDGAPTTLACTLTAALPSCSFGTSGAVVVAGAQIALRLDLHGATSGARGVRWSARVA